MNGYIQGGTSLKFIQSEGTMLRLMWHTIVIFLSFFAGAAHSGEPKPFKQSN